MHSLCLSSLNTNATLSETAVNSSVSPEKKVFSSKASHLTTEPRYSGWNMSITILFYKSLMLWSSEHFQLKFIRKINAKMFSWRFKCGLVQLFNSGCFTNLVAEQWDSSTFVLHTQKNFKWEGSIFRHLVPYDQQLPVPHRAVQ